MDWAAAESMISIKNLYYLLLYAWDRYSEPRMAQTDAEPDTELVNLFASVLLQGVEQLLRRGMDRGYVPLTEEVCGIRGKLNLSMTIKQNKLCEARTVCEFDELVYDVPHNQILKATLRNLLQTRELHKKLRSPIRTAYRRFVDVSDVCLSARLFGTVQLHRNISSYQLLLNICRLLHEHLIPDPATGKWRFNDLTQNEVLMRRIFEQFLYNFYRHEQREWTVQRPKIHWVGATGQTHFLPEMRTDIVLKRQSATLIIDAKYTPNVFSNDRFSSQTLKSEHLYQLFAYLSNFQTPSGQERMGLLIYPLANHFVDAQFTIGGYCVRVYTLDLNQHWRRIRDELLRLPHVDCET
jgi:5-methylcytosine-specific restriction enzyme subunit McrC